MGDTDTMAILTVTSAKDLLMPNPKLKLPPLTDTTDTVVLTDTTDTDTVVLARDPLRLNPSLTTDTDTVDTDMVVTDAAAADSDIMVEPLLKQTLKLLSGSSHSISFNLATTKIPSFFLKKRHENSLFFPMNTRPM